MTDLAPTSTTDDGCRHLNEALERIRELTEQRDALKGAVEEAAAREHGVGYGSKRKGRRCNLRRQYGCLFCRTLGGKTDV